MNRLRLLNKSLILSIAAGLLVLQWVAVTHSHDSDIDIDRICSICLVKENLTHGLVSSKLALNLNAAFADQYIPFTIQHSQVSVFYYRSRAPPVYL